MSKNKRITINKTTCTQCKKCERDCPSLAISIDTFTIDKNCIGCGHCVAICDVQAITITNKTTTAIHPHSISPEAFYNLSTQTRTCRHYKQKPIEDEIISKLIDNIANYPSASNGRQVQVTIITDPAKIKELNDFTATKLNRLFTNYTKPVIKQMLQAFMGKKEIDKLENYKELFRLKMDKNPNLITYNAPAIFIFHGKNHTSGMLQTDADIWATYTSLYASTFGLGTCFNGFIVKALQKDNKAKQLLSIPKSHTVYITLLAGYPSISYSNETSRDTPKFTIV